MPRKITPESFEVYRLAELGEPERNRAIQEVQGLLGGPWWDSSDIEQVQDEIVHGLAEALGAPGWDKYGPADFPGIDGLNVRGWDFSQGDQLALRGTLTRLNAPKLPWFDEASHIHLEDLSRSGNTRVEVMIDGGVVDMAEPGSLIDPCHLLRDAVIEAMFQAQRYGRAQLEYLTGPDYAADDIERNEREFYHDGRLYRG